MTEWTTLEGGGGVERKGAFNDCTCTEQWREVPACPGALIEMSPRYTYMMWVDVSCQFHGKGWRFTIENGCPRWEVTL